jgi:hypothetical protein
MSLPEVKTITAVVGTLSVSAVYNTGVTFGVIGAIGAEWQKPSAAMLSLRFTGQALGGGLAAGADVVWDWRDGSWWVAPTGDFGLVPTSLFGPQRRTGGQATFGFVYDMSSVSDLEQSNITAAWPASILHLMPRMFLPNRGWGALTQLAKNSKNPRWRHLSLLFGYSSVPYWQFGLRNNSFASLAGWTGKFERLETLLGGLSSGVSTASWLLQRALESKSLVQSLIDNTGDEPKNLDSLYDVVSALNR